MYMNHRVFFFSLKSITNKRDEYACIYAVFKRFLGRFFFQVFRGKFFACLMCVCIHHKDTHRKRERRINLVGEERLYLFCDGGEEHSFFFVFFVGGDREVRRYLFHSYLAEVESN
jgi:hypothetical protein